MVLANNMFLICWYRMLWLNEYCFWLTSDSKLKNETQTISCLTTFLKENIAIYQYFIYCRLICVLKLGKFCMLNKHRNTHVGSKGKSCRWEKNVIEVWVSLWYCNDFPCQIWWNAFLKKILRKSGWILISFLYITHKI